MIQIRAYKKKHKECEYIEDSFSQVEIFNLTPEQIKEYAESHMGKINTCFSPLVNRVGCLIADKKLSCKDIYVYMVDKDSIAEYNDNGFLPKSFIGYFSGI